MSFLTAEVSDLAKKIKSRDLKAKDVAEAFVEQIRKSNEKVKAFVTVNEKVIDRADEIDRCLDKGEELGPLAGIPIGIKDMLCTKGIKTTAGSKMLDNFIAPYSATVVTRLEQAGALVIGKCNQDEFAMGSSSEQSYYGACRNPWNFEYVPGGSSGGSAAAVAAGMSPAAIGTDTGGSIRQPAHFCGVVGVKPTYGRVSRYGIVAFASSLDQAGPLTRSVRDASLVMETICGQDKYDATTSSQAVPAWSKNLSSNLKGLKVGLPKEYFAYKLGQDTEKIVTQAKQWIKAAGAELVEVSIPLTDLGVPVYYLICTSEASSNLARYDGVRYGYRADFSKSPAKDLEEFYSRTRGEGFGPEVKRRLILGTYFLSSGYYDAYYKKACQVRRLLKDQFVEAFSKCDVLLSPVAATPAFKVGERIDDPLQMYLNDIFTTATNLVGLPGMSVPAGFSAEGLPIGVQIVGPHFEEQKMLNVALAIEEAAQVKGRVPDGVQ